MDVAVVIPCFNLGRTIVEAVDSVVGQTTPASEIVVVDDGSSDLYTLQVLAALSRPRLRVVQLNHSGAGAARNRGAALTTAPYLLFLDGDDALEPTYLERARTYLADHPDVDIVSTSMRAFGEASYVWTPPAPDLVSAFTRGTIPVTAVMRRAVWDAVGGFDEALPASMDLDFWIGAFERGFRGWVIDEPLLLRRVRGTSLHHAAVNRGAYRDVLERILRKHASTLDRLGTELLTAKEAFILEQRQDHAKLVGESARMYDELERTEQEIARLTGTLTGLDEAAVDLSQHSLLEPLSPVWGSDRGRPVDRYYIERFLSANRSDIRGRVLEIKDRHYTDRFGGTPIVSSDVLDIAADNPHATIVADLTRAESVPSQSFDCFILTQTVHLIYDIQAALSHALRILAPGGVLLATLPAVSRIDYESGGLDGGDSWRFTAAGLRRLFGDVFGDGNVEVSPAGNLRACIAFLYGLANHEVLEAELDHLDLNCPLIFCVRAVKRDALRSSAPATWTDTDRQAAILMYHRVAEVRRDPHGICVRPDEFLAHMEHLAECWTVMPLADLARASRAGGIPDGAIALTFDDGMLDALETVSPILLKLGLPATFFLNTERLDEEHEPWWEELGRILLDDPPPGGPIELDWGGDRRTFDLTGSDAREAAYRLVHRHLMRADLEERHAILGQLRRQTGSAAQARRSHRQLLGSEVRLLADRPGHTVGGHSVHHLFMPAQPPPVQRREIDDNKQQLEALLDRAITLFSYPYGAHDDQTVSLVRSAGYDAAVITDAASAVYPSGAFGLPRIDIKGRGIDEFRRVVSGHASGRKAARS